MLADTGIGYKGNARQDSGGCGDFKEKESWPQSLSVPREIAVVSPSSDIGAMPVSIGF
jgi:hypothetical protein